MPSGGFRRFWNALPIDGGGFLAPADPEARQLIAFATRRRLHRVPGPARPLLILAARLLWCVKAARRVRRAARLFGFSRRESIEQFADACLLGVQPKDSAAWRHAAGAPRRPLASDAFSKIQSSVGDPAQRRLLTDKRATAEILARLGIAVPALLGAIPRGDASPALPPEGTDMFVKPQSGSRSRDAFRVVRLAPELYRIDGGVRDQTYVAARLREAAAEDAVLVQQCLASAPDLADLATDGLPPVLRLVTACEPGGEPFLHSALFSIRVPGEPSGHPLRGLLRLPVAVATGSLLAGYWLGEPGQRYETSPWHDAPVAGRLLPGFDAAVAAVLAAAATFDRLPTIGWDVALSDKGPILLEGNSHTDWLFLTLIAEGAPDAVPLLPMLGRWAGAEE